MSRITNRMDTQAIQKETVLINTLLGVDDAYKAPSALMEILYNRTQRESLFKDFLTEAHYDMSYDWFHKYYQNEHSDRKKKQDFTPDSVAELLTKLVAPSAGGTFYEPCAGTGGIMIKAWNHNRKQHDHYRPSWYLYHAEELSDRAMPFLLFNALIRGMNAVIVQVDVLKRTDAKGVFFVQNDSDDPLQFSSLNLMPYTEEIADYFQVKWTNKRNRYKPLTETKGIPEHLRSIAKQILTDAAK
ncbi:N-6 DNA methylase [Shouchella lonarensis]|uniref:N-6 DNA Methylase n=1 Tax=Shouchella lonarensis TaxID=1464122 RepID=A0A1G6HMB7_9BACI|nr:N-6 DNA methylase [Shouchella lonarensis]SDB95409.1 N-6 DNA Methylase [Shouchella lonarensis]